MAEVWRDWLSAWDGVSVEAEEYRELDGQRVLVLTLYTGRGSETHRSETLLGEQRGRRERGSSPVSPSAR
jgi:hypothetical protein